MFNRKVLLMAVLAVVLLVTLMDGTVSVDRKYRHKPRRVEAATQQVALTNLMQPAGIAAAGPSTDQAVAAGRKGGHKRRVSLDAGGSDQASVLIAAADPNTDQAIALGRKGGHKRRI